MAANVEATDFPEQSLLAPMLARAYFHNSWRAELQNPAASPKAIFWRAAQTTPKWAEFLMSLRNRLARLIGLKDVGALSAASRRRPEDYGVGERFGIFSIFADTPDELVLGIDDSHLDVRVSVLKLASSPGAFTVSTLVETHNLLGKIYMAPVAPIHAILVRRMLARARV